MLFLSPHLHYMLTGIVQAEDVYHPHSGKYLNTKPGIDAEFFHGGCPRWAMEAAMDTPAFHAAWSGLPDDQPREAMISSFDTDLRAEGHQWDDETKEHVEQFLLNHPDLGRRYFLFEPPSVRMEEPWRGYDETHHHKIRVIAKELDADSQRYALEYEIAHKNRPQVVSDLTEIVGPLEDAEVVVPA